MENEIKDILIKLLEGQSRLETKVSGLETTVHVLETDSQEIKKIVNRIEEKVESIYDQTHDLTEYRTESNMKLDKISDDIDFLKHEEYQTKQDIFKINKYLTIIK